MFRLFQKGIDVLNLQAQVTARTDQHDSLQYGFTFLNPARPGLTMLNRLINRRGAYRVKPGPGEQIELQLWVQQKFPRESLLVTEMVDISVLGIGMTAQSGQDVALKNHALIDMSFQLPGTGEPRIVTARMISRRSQGNLIRYGLQFNQNLSIHWTTTQRTYPHRNIAADRHLI